MRPNDAVLLRGGRIVDPAAGRDEIGDVLIEDGLIVAVAQHIHAPAGAQVIDAPRLVVTPGLIDLLAAEQRLTSVGCLRAGSWIEAA